MAEFKPEYKQDFLTEKYKHYKINVLRDIPNKGVSGIATGLIGLTIITYGFTKYIIRQRADNADREARAAERSKLMPIIQDYIIRRDTGDMTLLTNNEQYKSNIEYLKHEYEQRQQQHNEHEAKKASSLIQPPFLRWTMSNVFGRDIDAESKDDHKHRLEEEEQKRKILTHHLQYGIQPPPEAYVDSKEKKGK